MSKKCTAYAAAGSCHFPLKLTFFMPADGWSLVAGSPVQNCGGRDCWRL
jgi:hypothetical protein